MPGGFRLKEDELANSSPLSDMIKRKITAVEDGEDKAQEIVDAYVKVAVEYEEQMRKHPNEPKHPEIRAVMQEAAEITSKWEKLFGLPLITLKQRADQARGMQLGVELPPGLSTFNQRGTDEYSPENYTLSGGVPAPSRDSVPTEGSRATQALCAIMPDPLDLQAWLGSWIQRQSDAKELQWLPNHMRSYLSWAAKPKNRTRAAFSIQDTLDRDALIYEDEGRAKTRNRALEAYERYKRIHQEAIASASTAFTQSLADTAEIVPEGSSAAGTQWSSGAGSGIASTAVHGGTITVESSDGKKPQQNV